jgi:hypothetical protein
MKERIIKEFGLRSFGKKGWMGNSIHFTCPVCGQYDKIGVSFSEKGNWVHCFHENHYNKHLDQYLREIGRGDLVEYRVESISLKRGVQELFGEEKEAEKQKELPEKQLPIGFKRVYEDEYLDTRGFLPEHYELFKPGITNIDLRQKGNIIFQIFDDRGIRVGWVSRSKKDKEWHKENTKKAKAGTAHLKLRYDNSINTDFSKMLGGITEITENTHTVLLVEGLFDKTNTDIELLLTKSEEIKCLFTFGDSITLEQIDLLKRHKNLQHVYLLYDYNTINNSKQYGLTIQDNLKCRVNVCEIKKEGKDPGNMEAQEFVEVLDQSVSALSFKIGKLQHV